MGAVRVYSISPAPIQNPMVDSSGFPTPPWVQWFQQNLYPRVSNSLQGVSLTGDVVGSGSSDLVTTISAGAVTLGKMAPLAPISIMGNSGLAAATPQALTGPQVTALLPVFGPALQGLAPASGGGTLNYLRADGSWVVPPAAGAAGGDLSGTYPNPTVGGLKGSAVPALATGALTWNGSAWTFSVGGGYALPTATSSVLGGVKPDGTSILNTAGAISVTLASIGAQAANTEGTWTPTAVSLGGSGIAYSARWIKTGNVVNFAIQVTGTALTATANTTTLSLPFTPARISCAGVISAGNTGVQVNTALINTSAVVILPTIGSTSQINISGTAFLD